MSSAHPAVPHPAPRPPSLSIIVLNSGSNGNAVYVESRATGAAVLLDCGISRRQIELRLKVHGRFAQSIRAVFITHEHGDHVRGLPVLTKTYHVPVYLTERTYRGLWARDSLKGFHFVANTETVRVEDLTVQAIPKSHDAADPVSFLVEAGGTRFLYSTDLGHADAGHAALLPTLDALLLESNYDDEMLRTGPYPEDLKARVRSDVGHLSNAQAMEVLERHCDGRLRALILGHVSENNNTPDIVLREAEALLARRPDLRPAIHVASRYNVGEIIDI